MDQSAKKNFLIEEVPRYCVYRRDLEDLDRSIAGAIVVSCFAVNELNVLSRLFIQSTHDLIENDFVDALNVSQRHVILRAWSAKIFEFFGFFELDGKHNKGASDKLKTHFAKHNATFQQLKEAAGYRIVRDVRNEATSHYRLKPAMQNIDHIEKSANLKLYLLDEDGNGFYPMGEEVMFVGRLKRAARSAGLAEDESPYEVWGKWNLEANTWVRNVHESLIRTFVFQQNPDRKGTIEKEWIPETMIGKLGETLAPLLLKGSKTTT